MPRKPAAAATDGDVQELAVRTCVGCTQTDTHPRHDVIIQLAPELQVASFHLDCHALIAGCESCAQQVAGSNGVTGEAMRNHIVNQTREG